jgi:5,6-dimethylbenzimidazole synthase
MSAVLTPQFTRQEVDAVYRVIAERRDVRHFVPGAVDEETIARLLLAAHQAPSVGYMQPWRFIRIASDTVRAAIIDLVEAERINTAEALGERGAEFMRLKVEGIRECGALFVVALADGREAHVFGRRTLPEMDLASVACAIQNMWLASRAEGLGMGWVSLFDPEQLAQLLDMPAGAQPVAVICLGHVDQFYPRPMLELEGWDTRRDLAKLVAVDRWSNTGE